MDEQTDAQTEGQTDKLRIQCLHLPVWRGGGIKTILLLNCKTVKSP